MRTKIKICGITNLEDALMVQHLGVDALGLIFAPSPRRITPDMGRKIIKGLGPFITTVAVFMDEEYQEVNRIVEYIQADAVQLHGNEPPEYCARIKRRVIKRISITEDDTPESIKSRCREFDCCFLLFDPGAGSGRVFDWRKLSRVEQPFILAGGLRPDNIREAIELLKPYGVDVCSGVEESPGKKDYHQLTRFIQEVRRCS